MSIQTSGPSDPAYVLRDHITPSPIVFASTHSGRFYPPSLLQQSRLSLELLRSGEDPLVDLLIANVEQHAVPTLCATFARAYVDLNRDPRELDPALFDPAPPAPTLRASDRVAAGLGVVPRMLAPAGHLYAGTLPLAEAQARLSAAHTPFHAGLERLLARAHARHGHALLVDVHSMPSQPGAAAPQVVVGDLHGRAAGAGVVAAVETALRSVGFRSARNQPYAGAYTLERHGSPSHGVHAIQLEFDRALYLDATRLKPAFAAAEIAERIGIFAGRLLANLAMLDLARDWPTAAE